MSDGNGKYNGESHIFGSNSPINKVTRGLHNQGLRMFWNRDSLPHVGVTAPMVRDSDPDSVKDRHMRTAAKVGCRMFRISGDEDGQKEYAKFMSDLKTAHENDWAVITCLDRRWDEKTGEMVIFVEWMEPFTFDTTEFQEGRRFIV